MPIVTKLIRVVRYREELPPINLDDPSMKWTCEPLLQIKYYHQKTHGHQTRQSADLPSESPSLKATWLFDRVTSVRSRGNLNIYISTFTRLTTTLAGCWLTEDGSAHKRLCRDQLMLWLVLSYFRNHKNIEIILNNRK